MSWRKITETDLEQKMSAAELSAVSETLTETIATVTDMVRGYVASAGVAMDEDTATVPARLIGPACDIIVVNAYIKLGGTLIDPKGHRKDAKDAAVRLLERVADKKFSVEDPTSGTESKQNPSPYYIPGRTRRRFDADSQRSL